MMSIRQGIEGLQFFPLELPVFLSGGRVLFLYRNGFMLRFNCVIEAIEEFLEILPFALRQAVLCRLAKTLGILIPVLLQHFKLVLRIALAGDQLPKTNRCLISF